MPRKSADACVAVAVLDCGSGGAVVVSGAAVDWAAVDVATAGVVPGAACTHVICSQEWVRVHSIAKVTMVMRNRYNSAAPTTSECIPAWAETTGANPAQHSALVLAGSILVHTMTRAPAAVKSILPESFISTSGLPESLS